MPKVWSTDEPRGALVFHVEDDFFNANAEERHMPDDTARYFFGPETSDALRALMAHAATQEQWDRVRDIAAIIARHAAERMASGEREWAINTLAIAGQFFALLNNCSPR